eukprot:939909-Karenia_brevis.AAC.1
MPIKRLYRCPFKGQPVDKGVQCNKNNKNNKNYMIRKTRTQDMSDRYTYRHRYTYGNRCRYEIQI